MNSTRPITSARTSYASFAPFLYPYTRLPPPRATAISSASPRPSPGAIPNDRRARGYTSTASTSHSVSYAYSCSRASPTKTVPFPSASASASLPSSSSSAGMAMAMAMAAQHTPLQAGGQRQAQAQAHAQGQRTYSTSSHPPHIPVIRTLAQLRRWRKDAREKGLGVGVVPTMGALHQGHLDLVRASMARNPLTVMTLFVNPMQFAPHEDLSSYPRQFERDLAQLQTLLSPSNPASLRGLGISENESFRPRDPAASASADDATAKAKAKILSRSEGSGPTAEATGNGQLVVFAPTPEVMYPLKGELQDLALHKGVSVDVKGWGEVMEGASRPQFFKGVATVCTKLFNAVEPDHAYFGQKDIQQALLLKIMVQDLLLSHPTPESLHILPTTRAPSGLALSSRNAYLSSAELQVAPTLHRALSAARSLYSSSASASASASASEARVITGEDLISIATKTILEQREKILHDNLPVEMNLDYIEIFDKNTFEPIRGDVRGREGVIAGALWVGKTRLIDNLLLGWETV